jgi:hypothetical protein
VSEIVPDDKDWTWVLQRPCHECGFDASSIDVDDVASMIVANGRQWCVVLGVDDSAVRNRPRPDRWSTLEYGAHVRDVYRLYERRLRLMLDTDDPLYPNWDQDETAITDRYGEQDPIVVAEELMAAAAVLAASFDGVAGDDWRRCGSRSDGAAFTVETFARYLIHDPVHHLWDVTGSSSPPGADLES